MGDGINGFMARDQERERFPELRMPTPEDVLGDICPICKGTTWVVRANAELEGPIMAQLEHCDNPGCPQMADLGVRKIMHLAVPYNGFNGLAKINATGQITALTCE